MLEKNSPKILAKNYLIKQKFSLNLLLIVDIKNGKESNPE